jgi:hypothetical protein
MEVLNWDNLELTLFLNGFINIYIYIYMCVCVFLPAITEENIVFFTIKLWDYELQVNRTDPTDAT